MKTFKGTITGKNPLESSSGSYYWTEEIPSIWKAFPQIFENRNTMYMIYISSLLK